MNITFNYKNIRTQNINRFLLLKGYSDNNIYYLIKNQNVLVNNEIVKDKNFIVAAKAKVSVTLNDEENELLECEENINIVYVLNNYGEQNSYNSFIKPSATD